MDWVPELYKIDKDLWIVLSIIWAAGLLASKRKVRAQTVVSRLLQSAIAVVGFYLLFSKPTAWSALGFRLFPVSNSVAVLAVVLTAAGISFAIWARVALGTNWSGVVTVKEGHTLVRKGPYQVVRHPIYTGLLTAALGTALLNGSLQSLIGVGLCSVAFLLKIVTEERFMFEEFGAEYSLYRKQVKALVPFLF
jgi:protein-S-isoprenylcysteine O-methyltransferase Ste14